MAEATDSNMQQFLSDRRISIAELSKRAKNSSETAAERNARLRKLAVEKRVSLNKAESIFISVCIVTNL